MDGFSVEVKCDHLQGVLAREVRPLPKHLLSIFNPQRPSDARMLSRYSPGDQENRAAAKRVCVTAAFEYFEEIRPAEKKKRERRLSLRLFTKMFEHFEGMKTAKEEDRKRSSVFSQTMASHKMNMASSRSHSLFTVIVETAPASAPEDAILRSVVTCRLLPR
jgi:hypothetical protein